MLCRGHVPRSGKVNPFVSLQGIVDACAVHIKYYVYIYVTL